jgi:hypothetical protein
VVNGREPERHRKMPALYLKQYNVPVVSALLDVMCGYGRRASEQEYIYGTRDKCKVVAEVRVAKRNE